MEDEVLKVEGMHCESCEKRIEAAVGDLAGVTAVVADRGAGTIDVTYDPDLTTLETIRNVIETEGYFVVA